MKRNKKFGFYVCPSCGLPLRYDTETENYICDTYWSSGISGCGSIIVICEEDELV